MSKSSRLLQLLELVTSRPGITMSEMVQELGLSERTLYRYLSSLSDELYVPIYCERGGYYVNGNCFLKPLNLTPQEMLATALSLTTSPAAMSPVFTDHARSSLRKISIAANCKASEMVQRSAVQSSSYKPNEQPEVMDRLLDAASNGNRISIFYFYTKTGSERRLIIDPYAVAYRRHSWYVLAYSPEHGKVIQLKVLRIKEISYTGERFTIPEGFTAEDYYRGSWEVWAGEPEVEVKVRFSARVASIIKETKRHPTQLTVDLPDGGVLFTARVAGTTEIRFWILGWGADAEVLSPHELRETVASTAAEMTARYREKVTESYTV